MLSVDTANKAPETRLWVSRHRALSSHSNKHELEPAVSSTIVNYTKPTNPNLTCKIQNVYS